MTGLVLQGIVLAVSAERGHRFSKMPQRDLLLVEGHGVEGDAHAGPFVRHKYLARRQPRLPNLRQAHLIPSELFGMLRSCGYEIDPGELGENITTAGLDLESLPVGTRILLGPTASVELTGLRTPCVLIDRFRSGLKQYVLPSEKTDPAFRCGVMGVIRTGGRVAAGAVAQVILPNPPHRTLPPI